MNTHSPGVEKQASHMVIIVIQCSAYFFFLIFVWGVGHLSLCGHSCAVANLHLSLLLRDFTPMAG